MLYYSSMLKEVADFGARFVVSNQNVERDKFNVGDTISVGLKISDGNVSRIQEFTGVCLAIRNKGAGSNFIVRKVTAGVAVERNVMLYSPMVAYIKLQRKGAVRRAKLYYMRGRYGKMARVAERIDKE